MNSVIQPLVLSHINLSEAIRKTCINPNSSSVKQQRHLSVPQNALVLWAYRRMKLLKTLWENEKEQVLIPHKKNGKKPYRRRRLLKTLEKETE